MKRTRLERKLVGWLKDKLKESGARGLVIGLSGGVDSSVVAALASQAAGGERTLGLIMPCRGNISDFRDARTVAKELGIRTKVIDLSGPFDKLIKILPKAGKTARYNIKPRLRMVTLYYFANKYNYLVCGTGNKSELMTGYFTKFGDGGVDLLPLGDLLKGQIRKLAEDLGIPEQIIHKAPSAGLWQGQTDEGDMGITYDELDGILAGGKKNKLTSRAKLKKVKRTIAETRHKRQGPEIFRIK